MRHLLAAMIGAMLAAPALAQLPPQVAAGQREVEQDCRGAGGRPSLMDGFRTELDLNGDGRPDYVHDLSHLNCEGAASFFCGSAGCPLVVYYSTPGGWTAQGLGHVQGWSVERSGALPILVLHTHGGGCGQPGGSCESRVGWNGRNIGRVVAGRPAAPAPSAAPPAVAALPPASPGGTKAPEPAVARPGAWEVRSGGDGRAIAVAAGPGVVRAVTVMCHQGVPVVAVALRARPPAGPVSFGLAGRSGRAEVPLAPGGGEVWYGDLRGSALVRLLTGAEAGMEVLVNGGMQGRLSLQGSTRAVREALAAC